MKSTALCGTTSIRKLQLRVGCECMIGSCDSDRNAGVGYMEAWVGTTLLGESVEISSREKQNKSRFQFAAAAAGRKGVASAAQLQKSMAKSPASNWPL